MKLKTIHRNVNLILMQIENLKPKIFGNKENVTDLYRYIIDLRFYLLLAQQHKDSKLKIKTINTIVNVIDKLITLLKALRGDC